jgi:hypothetical protein
MTEPKQRTLYQMNCVQCRHAAKLPRDEQPLAMADHPRCDICHILMGAGHYAWQTGRRCRSCAEAS